MKAVKGVKPTETLTINHAGKSVKTTPAEVWAALEAYRKPVLTDRQVKDLLEGAVESASSYWASELNPLQDSPDEDFYAMCIKYGFYVIDAEAGGKRIEVSPEAIVEACRLLRDFKDIDGDPMPKYYRAVLDGDFDDEASDVFLQLCAFKELVYG